MTVKPKPLFTPDGVACADAQARPWPLKHEPPLQPSSAKPMHGWRAERHVANENYNVTKWEGARWHARRRAVAREQAERRWSSGVQLASGGGEAPAPSSRGRRRIVAGQPGDADAPPPFDAAAGPTTTRPKTVGSGGTAGQYAASLARRRLKGVASRSTSSEPALTEGRHLFKVRAPRWRKRVARSRALQLALACSHHARPSRSQRALQTWINRFGGEEPDAGRPQTATVPRRAAYALERTDVDEALDLASCSSSEFAASGSGSGGSPHMISALGHEPHHSATLLGCQARRCVQEVRAVLRHPACAAA